ncbi:hypothetical protein [Chitinophaga polysaccharea]|nr:hypothetical protein [Chitinophaga polysaccharea]
MMIAIKAGIISNFFLPEISVVFTSPINPTTGMKIINRVSVLGLLYQGV